MQVLQMEGPPPNQGRMKRAIIGSMRKSRVALLRMVMAKKIIRRFRFGVK